MLQDVHVQNFSSSITLKVTQRQQQEQQLGRQFHEQSNKETLTVQYCCTQHGII